MVQYKLKQRGFYYFNSSPAPALPVRGCARVCVWSFPGVKIRNCTVGDYTRRGKTYMDVICLCTICGQERQCFNVSATFSIETVGQTQYKPLAITQRIANTRWYSAKCRNLQSETFNGLEKATDDAARLPG